MLYFSYGSNMSSRRLRKRVPSARCVTVATLVSHRLEFHKIGRDNSAKCNAHETGNQDDLVIGVVFDIHEQEKAVLDQAEGLGAGYEIKQVIIHADNGIQIQAFTYYATLIDDDLLPYHWYKQHVAAGAMEHNLPEYYQHSIIQVVSIADPDRARATRETAIHFNTQYKPGGKP